MIDILKAHYSRYPAMQIQDAVKLVYQNEFAGGHMIEDEQSSYRALLHEMHANPYKKDDMHLDGAGFEAIGNGLCRLHLYGLEAKGFAPETIHRFFINTANTMKGSVAGFEKKLATLRKCCIDGVLPYPVKELDAYLSQYKEKGYPPVHHSEAFKKAYAPAYRIVKLDYRKFLCVFERVDALLRAQKKVKVAIDGNSGSGKSTLASLLGGVYDCNLFHMDHFFLPPGMRTEKRLKETGGNVDYERFYREVIMGMDCGCPFQYRIFDCSSGTFSRVIKVAPKQLNIVEGCYSMHPTLIQYYDMKIFLHTGEKEQSRRILERSGAVLHKRFLSEWIPMENRYFEEMEIKAKCDLVFET